MQSKRDAIWYSYAAELFILRVRSIENNEVNHFFTAKHYSNQR